MSQLNLLHTLPRAAPNRVHYNSPNRDDRGWVTVSPEVSVSGAEYEVRSCESGSPESKRSPRLHTKSVWDSATPITTKHDNGLFLLTVSNFAVASYIHKQHVVLSCSVNFRLHLTRKLSIFTVVVI